MADFNASLPIRTEQAGDVQMKLVDGSDTAKVLKIEADGSINANISTGNLDVRDLAFATDKVDVSGSEVSLAPGQSLDIGNFPASFEISNLPATQAVSATDLDIRDLAYASDSVTAHLAAGSSVEVSNFPASFEVSNLPTSIEVSNFPASFEISNLSSITDLDIRDLSYSSDSVTAHLASGSQIEISNASLAVTATDLDIRTLDGTTDSVKVLDMDGNPLRLTPQGALVVDQYNRWGSQVWYRAHSAVAAGGSSAEILIPDGNTNKLESLKVAASGKIKVELQIEENPGMNDFMTVAVAYNSSANPNIEMDLANTIIEGDFDWRVVVYNREDSAMDIHSTILYSYY